MKSSVLASLVLAAVAVPSLVVGGVIELQNVSFSQGMPSRDVTVNYTLAGSQAFIRCDILTNGVSIGELNLNTFTGDYSDTTAKLISPGTHSFVWKARKDWPDNVSTNVQVQLQAYYPEEAGYVSKTYLVVDLSSGSSATSYDCTYLDTVPAGGWTADHKKKFLVMRRIPAGTFVMGSPSGEGARVTTGVEDQHTVSISKPFYIGVFELTQKQFNLIIPGGNQAMYFYAEHPDWAGDSMPTLGVNWADLRGENKVTGYLTAKTGFKFDYPTSAQWEYACRAGSTAMFPACASYPSGITDWSQVSTIGNVATMVPKAVGSYQCNNWGLYDMIGNMLEPTLDWYSSTFQYEGKDPTGPTTGTDHDGRGGSFMHSVYQSRTAQHTSYPASTRQYFYGCRLAIQLQ